MIFSHTCEFDSTIDSDEVKLLMLSLFLCHTSTEEQRETQNQENKSTTTQNN